jgi:hypothetical protein
MKLLKVLLPFEKILTTGNNKQAKDKQPTVLMPKLEDSSHN